MDRGSSDEANVVHNLLGQAAPELPLLSHQLAPLLRLMQQDHNLQRHENYSQLTIPHMPSVLHTNPHTADPLL